MSTIQHGAGVTLATAGKFHAFALAAEFSKLGVLENLFVSNRQVLAPAGVAQGKYKNRLDLALWRHAQAFVDVGYSEARKNRIYEEWLAGRLAGMPPGILHAWNGVAHTVFKRLSNTGWLRCVERSCPHNRVQYELLREEADLLGVPFTQSVSEMERAVEELYLADVIVVPSAYSASSYSDPELRKKVRLNTLGSNYAFRDGSGGNDKLRILMVGNEFLRKGSHYLIEAFKLIDDPDAELWLRGDIPAAYRSRISDPRIKVIGNCLPSRLDALYRSATVFVQPSIDEGFGMTVLEALAHGLPLVVTRNVGACDVLSDDVAVKVPIRDAEALARGIVAARNLAGVKFDAARRRIIEENSWMACAERMLRSVYTRGRA